MDIIGILYSNFVARVILSILILFVGVIVGRISGKLLKKGLNELDINKNLRNIGLKFNVEDNLSLTVTYFIYFFAILSSLEQLGISNIFFHVAFGLIMLLLILSFLLTIKDFFPNFIAGIHIRNKAKVGDRLKIDSINGKIVSKGIIQTVIETNSGDQIYIPNSLVLDRFKH